MQRLIYLLLALLAACQTKTVETSVPAPPAPAPAATSAPAVKAPVSRPQILNWPAGHVDTLQPKTPRPLPLTPSSAAAFARQPAAAPDTSEARNLRQAGAGVQRAGKTLTLPLCQGTQELVSYDQTDNPDSTIRYRFAGAVPGANQWLIDVGLWEGGFMMLVDRCTGRRHYAWNYPVPSPDRKFFIVASSDLEAQYSPTGMQLWAVTPAGVRKIWQREWPEDGGRGPAEVRWLDAHTVIIKEEFLADTAPARYVALDLNQLAKR